MAVLIGRGLQTNWTYVNNGAGFCSALENALVYR